MPSKTLHPDPEQSTGNGRAPQQPERRGGGAPVATRDAERDRHTHRGGLVPCPGPDEGAGCVDAAKVLPGKLCGGCRAKLGNRNARKRRGKG
ncbi:MAG TPA: hypothetical protein VLK89_01410 [Solirubrobacterales bacterium]|nr:hypothetical protein [Solirubrobacterales bacterium]